MSENQKEQIFFEIATLWFRSPKRVASLPIFRDMPHFKEGLLLVVKRIQTCIYIYLCVCVCVDFSASLWVGDPTKKLNDPFLCLRLRCFFCVIPLNKSKTHYFFVEKTRCSGKKFPCSKNPAEKHHFCFRKNMMICSFWVVLMSSGAQGIARVLCCFLCFLF